MLVFYRYLKAFVGAIGILVCLFAVFTVSAQGQTDGNKTAEPTAVIETKRDVGADRSIKERLQAIYREIDAPQRCAGSRQRRRRQSQRGRCK